MVTDLNFENSDNVTDLLVADFAGSDGEDLDTDDDGVLDVVPWSTVLDCVGLVETPGSGELVYCSETVGPDGSFVTGHAFDCPDGWEIGAFAGGDDTPGSANPCGRLRWRYPRFASTNRAPTTTNTSNSPVLRAPHWTGSPTW